MVELDVQTQRRECVTFVAATVANEGTTARRVRLRTDLRPVWPPRRQGVPAAGWTDDGVTLTVPAAGRRGIGFATPADPGESVLAVASAEPATDESRERTPDGLVRALGDPTPPADAVPTGAPSSEEGRPGTASDVRNGTAETTVGRPPRAVTAWLDRLAERDAVTDRDRAGVAAVAARATALAADLEER
ncbi:hypothetical protein [Haloarchaeobius sp. HRN-SO-5]|uniref:DUF7857 domain-containing protein n=1 Tax=Haloarchaeobius sp. HRN-SO-5 TaxID=3446118 RepID=UPI003EBCB9A7